MKKLELKYGKQLLKVNIPDKNFMCVLNAKSQENPQNQENELLEISRALDNPIGSPKLSEITKAGDKVAIMVSDITRPVPTKKLLPPIVDKLNKSGIMDEDIIIIFGMGVHRSHTPEEQKQLLGESIYKRIKCIDSSKDDYIYLGKSSRGTPINLCKSIVDANVRICTGNIEYHYFAGYSGGSKAIMPGASNYESIKHNHKLQLDDRAISGNIDDNPVRQDIDEIGKTLGINFILNVVLNEKKKILKAFAGDYIKAHREGCNYLDTMYSVKIKKKADIVIVSAGGYPKDINLYQAQKSLDNAKHGVKPGGTIILVSECREGFGSVIFEGWIREARNPEDLVERLKREFMLGGHKATAIARILLQNKVYLVSAMKRQDVEKAFLIPGSSIQSVLNDVLKESKNDAKVMVIPQGGSILPIMA